MMPPPLSVMRALVLAIAMTSLSAPGVIAANAEVIELDDTATTRPSAQLALSVENRLRFYKIYIDGTRLSRQQAGALHVLLASSDKKYLDIRRRAKVILRAERFR